MSIASQQRTGQIASMLEDIAGRLRNGEYIFDSMDIRNGLEETHSNGPFKEYRDTGERTIQLTVWESKVAKQAAN